MIIINADDYGKDASTSRAIVEAFSKGYCSSTTIMATGIAFEESLQMARDNHIFDKIGVHLNLIEGLPLTESIRKLEQFCNKDGYFNSSFRNVPFRLSLSNREEKGVAAEIRAQIEKCKKAGLNITHADFHQSTHVRWEIWSVIQPVLKESGITKVRIGWNCGKSNSLVKDVYKYMFNKQLQFRNYRTTDYFGSVQDVLYLLANQPALRVSKIIEIMVHPHYNDDMKNLLDLDAENTVCLADSVRLIPGWEEAVSYSAY